MLKLLMGGGASVVGALLGGLGITVAVLGFATLGFERWEMHKAGLRGEGRMMCTIDYEKAARASERIKADEEKARAIDVARAATESVDELRGQYDTLSNEYAELAAASNAKPAVDPNRCLSDSVLGRFTKSRPVEGRPAASGGEPRS